MVVTRMSAIPTIDIRTLEIPVAAAIRAIPSLTLAVLFPALKVHAVIPPALCSTISTFWQTDI